MGVAYRSRVDDEELSTGAVEGVEVLTSDNSESDEESASSGIVPSLSTAHLEACSDIQVGPRLHYHAPVVINQNFVKSQISSSVLQDQLPFHVIEAPIKKSHSTAVNKATVTSPENVKVIQMKFGMKKKTINSLFLPAIIKRNKGIIVLIFLIFMMNVLITWLILHFFPRGNQSTVITAANTSSNKMNFTELVRQLKEHCKDLNHCFNLFTAVQLGDLIFVDFLLEAGSYNTRYLYHDRLWAPLHYVAYEGNLEIVQMLAKSGANLLIEASPNNDIPVNYAALRGHYNVTEWFLNQNISVMVRNKLGSTLLHAASSSGNVKLCKLLIERGAEVNARMYNYNNFVPLHKAVWKKHLEVAKLLLDSGAEVDAMTSPKRETPLHYTANNCDVQIIKLLLSHGANISLKNNAKKTPLALAYKCKSKEISELLSYQSDLGKENNSSKDGT